MALDCEIPLSMRFHATIILTIPAHETNKNALIHLDSYRGTAEKCKFEGDTVRHFNAGKLATFELRAPGYTAKDIQVNIISK